MVRTLLFSTVFALAAVASATVRLGIDKLSARGFEGLRGQRVGLLTHPAGVDSTGRPTLDILHSDPRVNLTALYGPEHGIDGKAAAEKYIPDRVHRPTGLTAYSLYGPTRKPTPEMLAGIDVLVVDLQDIGTRSYTYVSAMKLAMEACFEQGKAVMVLDRPNPLGGLKVDGPPLDDSLRSYVGAFPVPYVHGLTIAELAVLAKKRPGWLDIPNSTRRSGRLIVVPMKGWRRSMLWPHTGLRWVPTSPAIPDFNAALGYPMTGLGCQLGGFKHGYGTPFPFRLLSHRGWSDDELATLLNGKHLSGLSFRAVALRDSGGKEASGVYVYVDDWNAAQPTALNFHLMTLAAQAPGAGNPFAEAADGPALLFNKHVGSHAWWRELTRNGARADVQRYLLHWELKAKAFQRDVQSEWIYDR